LFYKGNILEEKDYRQKTEKQPFSGVGRKNQKFRHRSWMTNPKKKGTWRESDSYTTTEKGPSLANGARRNRKREGDQKACLGRTAQTTHHLRNRRRHKMGGRVYQKTDGKKARHPETENRTTKVIL